MQTSKRGIIELLSHEAIVLNPYRDSKGVWTVGVGHTAAAGLPNPKAKQNYSLAEIFKIFLSDIKNCEVRVGVAFKSCKISQHQFDAAVSFDFNTGAIHRASWVRHFKANNFVLAKKSFMNWRRPREIIKRRKKECELFFAGVYSGNGYVSLYGANKVGRVLWQSGKRVKVPNQFFALLGCESVKQKSIFSRIGNFIKGRKV